MERGPISLNAPIHDKLFRPVQLRVYQDNLYILDFGDMKLKRFTLQGHLLTTIGEGRGQAPGDLALVSDFVVVDSVAWLVDSRRKTVSKFSINGSFIDRFIVETFPLRMSFVDNYIVLMHLGGEELFQITSKSGEVRKNFGSIISGQERDFLSLDGLLAPAPHSGFVYVPRYASYLYYYDKAGDMQKIIQTIDRQTFPKSDYREGDGRQVYTAPTPDIQNESISVYNDILYILVHMRISKMEERAIVDRYRWSDGTYLSSTRLPFIPQDIAAYDNVLYCLLDTTVVAYKIDD